MPTETARLIVPAPALAGLVAAAIVRDTRGVALGPAERVSFFPAAPVCAVTWVWDGVIHDADLNGVPAPEPLPGRFFTGPRSRPSASRSPGPVHAMTVAFYPEAWRALTGVAPGDYADRSAPLSDLPRSGLREALEALSPDDGFHGLTAILDDFRAAWRPPSRFVSPYLSDWLTSLFAQVAVSATGRSARQFQRRLKALTGRSRRELEAHARAEALFARALAAGEGADLAGLAHDGGYADQSHMGREMKRITGLSPARINRLIATDERFWCYRLLGERF